jgi:hypothetical protein
MYSLAVDFLHLECFDFKSLFKVTSMLTRGIHVSVAIYATALLVCDSLRSLISDATIKIVMNRRKSCLK